VAHHRPRTYESGVGGRERCVLPPAKNGSTMRSFDSIVTPPIVIAPAPQCETSLRRDRDALEQRLAHAEGYMAMSKQHIASQRTFAAGLLRDGHDASLALALLLRFEELQQLHIADRDRLREELGM
jgi:hypothetical protein